MTLIVPGPMSFGPHTLDAAYTGGQVVDVDLGAIPLTNNNADNSGILALEKSPAGVQSGDLIRLIMGANTTGTPIDIVNGGSGVTMSWTGTGLAGQLHGPSGSDSNPTYGYSADPDSGTRLGTVGQLNWVTAGSTRAVLNSAAFQLNGVALRTGSVGAFFGVGNNASLVHNIVQTPNAFVMGLPATSKSLILMDIANVGGDYGHSLAGTPTMFVHSSAAAGTATDQWLGLTHTGTVGEITTGVGGVSVAGLLIDNDGTTTTLLGTVGDYLRVGNAGVTSQGLASEDDLMVTGKLEVDGPVYHDGTTRLAGSTTVSAQLLLSTNISMFFGGAGDSQILYSTLQAASSLVLGVPVASNALLVVQRGDTAFNFGHLAALDPTIFLHSSATSTTEWGSLTYSSVNGTFNIDTGAGYVAIGPVGTVTNHGAGAGALVVSGLFEVNGQTWFDAGVHHQSNVSESYGAADDFVMSYRTAPYTNATMAFSVAGVNSKTLIITNNNFSYDHAPTNEVDPTLKIYSANNSTTEWGSLAFDQTDFVIDGGIGNIRLARNLARTTAAGVTASVTQTQGQGALTADVNEVTTVANPNDTVTLPAVFPGMVVRVANHGANTLQIFPAAGHDLGAGTNVATTLGVNEHITFCGHSTSVWDVSSGTQRSHAEFTQSQNTTAYVMASSGQPHCYHSATLGTGLLSNWTFDAGGAGTTLSVSSVADGGGGEIDVTTSAAHGLAVGDIVSITNTTTYDGVAVVASIGSSTVFGVVRSYAGTATGSANHACTLEAGMGQAGTYLGTWSASATSATNNETFDYVIYVNAVAQTKTEVRRKFGTGGDFGSMGNSALLQIAEGDLVSFTLQNNDSAGNTTVRNINLVLLKQ